MPWVHLGSPEALVDSSHKALQHPTPNSYIPTWGNFLRGQQGRDRTEEQASVRDGWELAAMPNSLTWVVVAGGGSGGGTTLRCSIYSQRLPEVPRRTEPQVPTGVP